MSDIDDESFEEIDDGGIAFAEYAAVCTGRDQDNSTDKGICTTCDKPVFFMGDGSHSDHELCLRSHPFCTNHEHKVDWRTRAKAAEAELGPLKQAEALRQMVPVSALDELIAKLEAKPDVVLPTVEIPQSLIDALCAED